MRDYLLLVVIFSSLPFCFTRPFFGGLVWTWLAFMNPHRLAWGVASEYSIAMLVAVATLAGFIFSGDRRSLPRNFGTYGVFALWILLSLSTLFAEYHEEAVAAWTERSKIMLMSLVVMAMTTSRERLRLVCLVTALSVSYFGFTGGVFAIVTGGQYRVYGPENTFLGANNGLALALNMVLPFVFYLANETQTKLIRVGMHAVFGLSVVAALCSYSRGGVIGLTAVLFMLTVRRQRKLLAIVALCVGLVGLVAFAPDKLVDRLNTIQTYDQDESSMARIRAWRLAWRLAVMRPLIGWGPQSMEHKSLYERYYPDSPTRADVHSAYFQVLGENGFPATAVFLMLLIWCLLRTQRLRRQFKGDEERSWIANYAEMLQISMMGFMISGLFLEKAYFDLLYHVVGATAVLDGLARKGVEESRTREVARVEAPPLPLLSPLPWTTDPRALGTKLPAG